MSRALALLENNTRGCQETLAVPEINIQTIVEKEITVIEHGQKVTKLVPVSFRAITSSLKLYFTVTITNQGDGIAINVVVDNPIPRGTVYAIGSATGEKSTVTCSNDNGLNYHAENEQLAKQRRCTDIRWVVEDIPPKTSHKLRFQVIVYGVATYGSPNLSRWFISQLPTYRGRVLNA